jgi:hypothetical protein
MYLTGVHLRPACSSHGACISQACTLDRPVALTGHTSYRRTPWTGVRLSQGIHLIDVHLRQACGSHGAYIHLGQACSPHSVHLVAPTGHTSHRRAPWTRRAALTGHASYRRAPWTGGRLSPGGRLSRVHLIGVPLMGVPLISVPLPPLLAASHHYLPPSHHYLLPPITTCPFPSLPATSHGLPHYDRA